jgi:hypothetical protein
LKFPHSVAALKPELAEIRANLPPAKPAYEDPVPFIEAMPETDVLRIAAALAFVRPLTPYPNWYFDADWQNPDLGYRIRRSIWTYFSRRKTAAALDIPWHSALKLRIYLGNDISRQQYVAGCLDPNEFALLDKLLAPGMVFIDAAPMRDSIQCSHLIGWVRPAPSGLSSPAGGRWNVLRRMWS